MKYIKDENKFRINWYIVTNCILVLMICYRTFKDESINYHLKNNPNFVAGETAEKICYHGVNGLLQGQVYSQYYNEEIWNYLKDNPASFNFETDDKIIDIKYRDGLCKVIVETNSGLRGLDVYLEQSMNNREFYSIKNIRELDNQNIKLTTKD
ncbi:MAG: hypothetical protein H7281_15115 [Bacteriovorax sp.]|nr:hypothetical protein [Bacteriovorax sp.]